MTAFYGGFDRAAQEGESLRTIAKAVEMGINFLDTAWVYQVGYVLVMCPYDLLLLILFLFHF